MSTPRSRPLLRLPPRTPPPESDARTATRAERSAGASPNRKTVDTPTPPRTSRTRPSIGVSTTIGRGETGVSAARALRAQASTAGAHEHAADREEQALGHELPHHARRTRAERQPHGHFVLARRAALEEEVRDVRAHDQQHQPVDAEHHGEQRRQAIDGADVERRAVRPRSRSAAKLAASRAPVACAEARADCERRARGEAPEHPQPPNAALVEQIGTPPNLRLHRHRNPEVQREVRDRSVESLRRDADNRHRLGR